MSIGTGAKQELAKHMTQPIARMAPSAYMRSSFTPMDSLMDTPEQSPSLSSTSSDLERCRLTYYSDVSTSTVTQYVYVVKEFNGPPERFILQALGPRNYFIETRLTKILDSFFEELAIYGGTLNEEYSRFLNDQTRAKWNE